MNSVVHFEMPYDDPARVARFYEQEFGWRTQTLSVNVRQAGGTVLGEPMEIPGVGQYVSFIDTEGNRVSMLQPVSRNWHAPKTA